MKAKVKSKNKHMTYQERIAYYKSYPLWPIVEKEIEELIANKDIELTTAQDIVVASIIKAIEGKK